MSSVSTMGPDSPVTIKVAFDGTAKKVKIPLRDMVPKVLEDHIRRFLQIPANSRAMIERYSDSAAAYVLLDSNNLSIYKQLYRAAKAKSKLKLRVTLLDQSRAPVAPMAVSVESEKPSFTPQASSSQTTLPLRVVNPTPRVYDKALLSEAAKLAAMHNGAELNKRLSCILGAVPSPAPVKTESDKKPSASANAAVFSVCCNSCEDVIPDAHYHCSTCEDGDFDLCQQCIDRGITCFSDDHWLIKRSVVDGVIVKSCTETLAPKIKPAAKCQAVRCTQTSGRAARPPTTHAQPPAQTYPMPGAFVTSALEQRTCNNCLSELFSSEVVHCEVCADFDLCQNCFSKDFHGHNPMHAFAPAVPGTTMPEHVAVKMPAGRNRMHLAICDGCEKTITGVRHKCLDCPDWDYCAACVENANFVHPDHRFVAISEPTGVTVAQNTSEIVHMGICCDGPLCSSSGWPSYIRGFRYKCAVCHDVDFCANCEANPSNNHNKTHPLIKFKSPVRNVSVTTFGQDQHGEQMPAMGDRSTASSPTISSAGNNSMNPVQTVVNVAPQEPTQPEIAEKPVKVEVQQPIKDESLQALFVRDTVPDGSIMAPNAVFQQTWTLKNKGEVAWPAGCAVTFVGGDYMGHVDSTHPAGISELVSASKSTTCYNRLAPGQEFQFTVLLRSPARPGKFISYWRLATEDGEKFGDRLWCEVNVRAIKTQPKSTTPVKEEATGEKVKEETTDSASGSTMIFPKLEKESPSTSIHDIQPRPASQHDETSVTSDALDDGVDDEEWDGSDEGFLTDEEYDILDASDEEYLEEQHRKMLAK